jgi:hopanoid biosynthesis associated protein HpnK
MATRRLIVNADDFGLTDGVNRAIIDGHRCGIITSATLMVNGRAFESAVVMAAEVPRLGVGIHLNLIEGPPVAGPSAVSSLVDRRGLLANSASSLAARIATGRVRLAEVERELRAQIERALAAGVRITHLDGHKHAHLAPAVFDVVVGLAVEYGIRGVRCAVESRPDLAAALRANRTARLRLGRQHLAGRVLSALAAHNRRKLRKAGLRTPARILGITQTGFLCPELLERMLRSLDDAPSELMCHPGYVDDALLSERTRLTASRELELEALTAPETWAVLDREGIELITYADLAEAI